MWKWDKYVITERNLKSLRKTMFPFRDTVIYFSSKIYLLSSLQIDKLIYQINQFNQVWSADISEIYINMGKSPRKKLIESFVVTLNLLWTLGNPLLIPTYLKLFYLSHRSWHHKKRSLRSKTIFCNSKVFKNDKKFFLFHFKSSFRPREI